jgi:pimeloyl-ACP methyl ester carboxylesterase
MHKIERVMRPVYLGTGASAVFALHHAPGAPGGGTPVLVVGPLGFDDICSHATRKLWAEHLAAGGHDVLRIDLPGTGDSGGTPRDPGLVAAWVDGVARAARWLAATTGVAHVAGIGVGVGGLLLREAAAAGAPLGDLVLWGPPASGRRAVRELKAFGRLETAKVADDPAIPDGALAVGGFLFTAETLADLGALDPAAATAPAPDGARALVLRREDAPADDALVAALGAAGYTTTTAPGPGHAEMMDEPRVGKPAPAEVFARVDTWLADGAAPAAVAGAELPEASMALEGVEVDGVRVAERPVTVEQPFGRLFGVLAEDASGRAQEQGLVLVLLNAGAQRHIGPNRMWVETARRWAARGLPSLRFDVGGVGDTDPDGEPWSDDDGFYTEAYGAQVVAALDALQAARIGERFVLMGLCSGGYWSFEVAGQDDRVVAALMLNPGALVWDRARLLAWQSRRIAKLKHPKNWLRLFSGEFSRRDVSRVLRGVVGAVRARLPGSRARKAAAPPQDPAFAAFDHLREQGKRGLLAFGPREQLRIDYADAGLYDGFADRWPNVTLDLFDGEAQAHELQPPVFQQRATALVDAALARELQAGAGAVPAAR